jgi:alpha-tubulin suppressor-like RCC1 family protein
VVQVATGWGTRVGHGLAVRSDGTAWTWGFNREDELGDGTTTDRLAPVQVTGLTGVTQAAGGCTHSLALRSDGTVWAWSANGAGQLGRGTISADEVTPAPVTRPVNTIGAGSGITQISAGADHMVALKSDGTVLARGDNTNGEFGNGTTTPVTGPAQVTGLTGATQVAAGIRASFAVHAVTLITVPDLTGDTKPGRARSCRPPAWCSAPSPRPTRRTAPTSAW